MGRGFGCLRVLDAGSGSWKWSGKKGEWGACETNIEMKNENEKSASWR